MTRSNVKLETEGVLTVGIHHAHISLQDRKIERETFCPVALTGNNIPVLCFLLIYKKHWRTDVVLTTFRDHDLTAIPIFALSCAAGLKNWIQIAAVPHLFIHYGGVLAAQMQWNTFHFWNFSRKTRIKRTAWMKTFEWRQSVFGRCASFCLFLSSTLKLIPTSRRQFGARTATSVPGCHRGADKFRLEELKTNVTSRRVLHI